MAGIGNPGKEVAVMYKVESAFGTPVTGAGAEQFRIHSGSGLTMARSLIEDPEVRRDGMESMPRLGPKTVNGTYPGTLSVGTFNTFLGALFRHAWAADVTAVTCDGGAVYTSLATTVTNTLTLVGTGSFLTQGVRVGDVVRLSAMGAGVDNINAVVATVSANSLTVLGAPWTNITADSNAVLTIKKKLKNAAGTIADPLVDSSYTIEEYQTTIDESEQFCGCVISSLKLSFTPTGVVKVEFGVVGQDVAIVAAGAGAPAFTTPTEYTSIGLIAADARIYLAGAAIATVTGGELTFDLGAKGIETVGSLVTPGIWAGNMKVSGQITAVRTLLTGSHLARFIAETDNVELSLMFVEPDAAVPIDFVHVFIPRLKYTGDTKQLGEDGPIVETIPFKAACKATTTGYDSVVATISTSA